MFRNMWNTTQFYAYSNRIGVFRKIPYLIKRTIGWIGCYTKMSVFFRAIASIKTFFLKLKGERKQGIAAYGRILN